MTDSDGGDLNVVYVLTMEAVYDHGCGGVFTSRAAAEAHAQALYEDSDRHHDFRIDEVHLDTPVWLPGRGKAAFAGQRQRPTRPQPTSFVAWEERAEEPPSTTGGGA